MTLLRNSMKIQAEVRNMECMEKPADVSYGTTGVQLTPASTVVRVTMDLFQHRYYRLIKILLTLLGQWPYQSIGARRRIPVVVIFIVTTATVPIVLALVKNRNDWKITLDCILVCLSVALCTVKFVGIIYNSEKILKLFNCISTNWQVWAQDREVNILHEYADYGEKILTIYTGAFYSSTIIYITQPAIPKIIDVILNNGTKPGEFPFPVDYYYFDGQKYYFYIMGHCCIWTCVAAMPVVASSTMLIICVQHVCSVFTALGHKFEQIGNNDISVENVELRSLIGRHNDAIEFANLIEATYTWTYFVLIGFGMIFGNLIGVQIIMGTDNPDTIVRFITYVLGTLFEFYLICYVSQILMNHSISVGYYIYNNQWYRLLPRDQKLLKLMIMQCRVPCQLTAGKILILSLRNFALTLKTAMSYFAVVRPK